MNVTLIRWIDRYLGSPLCVVLGLFSKKESIITPKSILCVQLWGVGETILCLPTIHELIKKYPKARIEILATSRNKAVFKKYEKRVKLITLNPFSLFLYMIKNWNQYDLVIDMEEYLNISSLLAWSMGKQRIGYSHGARSALYQKSVKYNDKQHVSQTFMDLLKPLGIKKKVSALEKIPIDKKDEQAIKKLLKNLGIKKKVWVCAPGTAESSKIRMWSEQRWAALISFIRKKYTADVVLVGDEDADEANERIMKLADEKEVYNLAGKTTLPQLFALMKWCKVMVSIDSGPMHVGASQGVCTIGLFDPNTPVRFGPLGKKNRSVYKPVAPSPVINVHKGQVPSKTRYNHMSKIQVEDVMDAISQCVKK